MFFSKVGMMHVQLPQKKQLSADSTQFVMPSGLVCHYDISDSSTLRGSDGTSIVTTHGSTIYTIKDKSSGGNDLKLRNTTTGASFHTLNKTSGLGAVKPVLQIGGANTTSVTGYTTDTKYPSFTNAMEYFAVIRPTGSDSIGFFLNKCSNEYPGPFDRYGSSIMVGNGGSVKQFTSGVANLGASSAEGFMLNTIIDKANNTVQEYKNADYATGFSVTSANVGSYADVSSKPLFLCSRPDNYSPSTNTSRFEVGEILMFNVKLSAADRALVEGYLACKWGMQKKLPAAHAYYSKLVVA